MSTANAFLITEALHSAIYGGADRGLGGWMGTGWRAAKELKRSDLAGKTGTTNEAKDAWFSGFTPNVVATAWVGFDDHRRALGRSIAGNEFGASAAQPIWIEYMKVALHGIPDRAFAQPDDIVTMHVNNYSGLAMTGSSPGSREEFFEKGSEPSVVGQQESVLFDNGDINSVQPQTPPSSTSAAVPTTNSAGTDDIF
jgi:penicillin-binding protein 1A